MSKNAQLNHVERNESTGFIASIRQLMRNVIEMLMPPKSLEDLSPEERQNILNDLRLVGEEKPLGYIPISILREICGVDPQKMREELEAKGLIVVELTCEESGVNSGALYAYHRDALNRLLESGKPTLEKNGWPTEPDDFIRHLKVFAKNQDLYRLVMHAFADPRLKKE